MTVRITKRQKREWNPALIKYYGKVCFYCENTFVEEIHYVDGYYCPFGLNYDHLNNIEYDNRPVNIVMSHAICNQRKKHSTIWTQKAVDQLVANESDGTLLGMCERINKKNADKNETIEDNKVREQNEELFSNPEFMRITLEYITEKLEIAERLPYKATCDAIAMKCFNIIGHGSPNTIYRAVGMLTSDEGRFSKYRSEGKQWISKKNPLMEK